MSEGEGFKCEKGGTVRLVVDADWARQHPKQAAKIQVAYLLSLVRVRRVLREQKLNQEKPPEWQIRRWSALSID